VWIAQDDMGRSGNTIIRMIEEQVAAFCEVDAGSIVAPEVRKR
jgi:hypothetical protein